MSDSAPRIILTGFMGAGKTTVAKALARLLACRMIDLDELIAASTGRSIRALIDEDGEARFREVETRALQVALEDEGARVIALGGGTWTVERHRALLDKHNCFTVWLDAPFDLCWRRIESIKDARPLARDKEKARRLYDERLAIYKLAMFRVEVEEKMPEDELASEILARLFGES
jgi:shikimate kinase